MQKDATSTFWPDPRVKRHIYHAIYRSTRVKFKEGRTANCYCHNN